MTNFEYYKDQILEITDRGWMVAIVDNKPVSCKKVSNCSRCDLAKHSNTSCESYRIKWLYEEHIEQPKLTKKERQFCELVETGWIVRNKSGSALYIKDTKPTKQNNWWISSNLTSLNFMNIEIFNTPFSFITWEDEEPWSVEDLLKLEVEE